MRVLMELKVDYKESERPHLLFIAKIDPGRLGKEKRAKGLGYHNKSPCRCVNPALELVDWLVEPQSLHARSNLHGA